MLVQQPQSKSKIVTVQAAGKLQEISGNQQENQHFSAGNRRQKNHQVFGHYFLRWPWQDPCYLGRPSTKQINRSYDLDGFGSRMVSIRVLCNPGACSLHACKCLMFLTVHSCVKGSKGFRCITSLLWVFCLSCSFASCQVFPKNWFHPAKNWCGWHMIYPMQQTFTGKSGRLYGGSFS